MAPERTPRPGGSSLPGTRSSVPAKSALSDADGPSREEVQQRIHSLYDQAENATGFVNGTRAMTTGSRNRANPAPETVRRRSDPALDDISKPWFDAARRQLGPSAPARLPADRLPNRAAETRPAGPAGRPQNEPADRGRESAGRPVLELTAGPSAEAAGGPVAELTGRAVAALPAAPETRQDATQVMPTLPSLPALPAPAAPVAGPRPSSLKTSKEQIQRKLATARELLSRHVAQRTAPVAAIEARPAEDAWRAAEEQALRQAEEQAFRQAEEQAFRQAGEQALRQAQEQALRQAQEEWQRQLSGGLGTGLSVDTGASIGAGVPLAVGNAPSAYVGSAETALAFARAQIGRPCLWGATGPDSYDSASLTQAAWRSAGVTLPRTVHEQATAGTAIPLTDIRVGDLIFFSGNISHVGLYTGNSMMIHAPGPGASIREESIFFAGQTAIHGAVRPA